MPRKKMSQPNGTENLTLPILYRDKTDPNTFYEAAWGRVFNERRDTSRKPLAVVFASRPEHVTGAIELAKTQGCRVSVRSGGHSWAAWSVRDEAILIDLGQMNEVYYDEESQIVSCSPSTTGRVINKFLNAKGRVFPGGHCPDVGLGGFLLQGGMGWNCKVRSESLANSPRSRQVNIQVCFRTGVGRVSTSSALMLFPLMDKSFAAAKTRIRIFSGPQGALVPVCSSAALCTSG